ncbi:MAG: phage terminase large subunit [Steroidobacteraceae bacterium]
MLGQFTAIERAVAASQARERFYFFSRYMFQCRRGDRWQRAPHHALICWYLTQVFLGVIKRLIINIPPRYSKTELAVICWVAWCLGKVPDAEFIHTSYASGLADENSARTRDLVAHEVYREIFPETQLASFGKAHWKTTRAGVMYAAGAGGTITGFGAGKIGRDTFGGAIIIDDPHKPEEARNAEQLKKDRDWFQETLESRKNSRDTPIVVIMQRLAEDDLSGWLLEDGNGEHWERLILPAIQEDGTALWPEKHSIEQLHQMERAAPYMFAGQYGQRPFKPAGNIFRPDQMPIVNAIPIGTRFCRGWDLGASDVDGDPSVGLKLGKMPDGRYVIADVRRFSNLPDEVEHAVKNTADADGKTVEISLAQDPGQAGRAQVASYVKLLEGFKVHTSTESGDKVTRAEPFAAQVNVGNVCMLRAPWNDALTAEMRLFPNAKHDDQVDAGSRAFNRLAGGGRWAF